MGLYGVSRSESKASKPPGVSPETVAMLERMKRKVARQVADANSLGEQRSDSAVSRVERFRLRYWLMGAGFAVDMMAYGIGVVLFVLWYGRFG